MNRLYNQIKRFIQFVQEQVRKLPEFWLMLRAYLQGLIALLRLMSIAMSKRLNPAL